MFSYPETFEMRGPVFDGYSETTYCSVECAEEDEADENGLFEINAEFCEKCPVCGKVIANVSSKEAS